MSAESVTYSVQNPPPCSADAASTASQKARESCIPFAGKDSNLPSQQIAEQYGHVYGSTIVAGTGTAVLGDRHGNEHHQINTFHITKANFVLPNVPATLSATQEEVRERRVENDRSESVSDTPTQCESNEAGIWLVPFERTERLIGRDEELAVLATRLSNGGSRNRVAIAGLGGVGKSRLAIEFANIIRHQQQHLSVFWVQCSDLASFERDCRGIAKALKMPVADDPKVNIKSALKNLGEAVTGEWLIILDNADDEELWSDRSIEASNNVPLLDYIPRSQHGSVLVTTRSHKIAVKIAAQNVVRLNDLSESAACIMLKELLVRPRLLDDPDTTAILLKRISCLPLALVQAAAYINENDLHTIKDYLQLWDSTEEDIIELLSEDFEDSSRYSERSNAVTVTWLISFDQIRRRNALAAKILSHMACLDSQSIPRSALPIKASLQDLNKAFGMLTGYALIQPQPYEEGADVFYDMHRLVHLATRNWLRKQGTFAHWLRLTAEHMYKICPWGSIKTELAHYLPHAEQLCATQEVQNEPICIKLIDKLAAYFDHTTQLAKAIDLLRRALHWREQQEGLEAIDTVECSLRLGWVLHCHGELREAQDLMEPALKRLGNRLDKDDLRVLRAKSLLPNLYRRQGRLAEAEALSREVVETSQKILGPADELTLDAMRGLAWTYREQWDLQKAEKLLLSMTSLATQRFGEGDLRSSKYNGDLALILSRQGRTEEAILLLESLLHANANALGEEHADTLQCMFDLAIMYRNKGQFYDAEALFLKEIAIEERMKPDDDFDLIMTKSSLAKTYFAQRRYKDAETMQQFLIEKGLSLHGQINPSILLFKTDLANTRWKLGHRKEALELLRGCMRQSEEILGTDHKMTIDRRKTLEDWTDELDGMGNKIQTANTFFSDPNAGTQEPMQSSGKFLASPKVVGVRSSTMGKRSFCLEAYTAKKRKLTPHLMQFPELPKEVTTGKDPP